MIGYEGDLGLSSDRATVGGAHARAAATTSSTPSIDVGDATRVPPEKNQYGFDAQLLEVDGGLKPDPDGLAVTFTTTDAEAVYIGGVARRASPSRSDTVPRPAAACRHDAG